MPRIPLVDPANASEEQKKGFDSLPRPVNIFRMIAHAEGMMRPILRLGASILSRQELSARDRELVILAAAHLVGGAYEWAQHVPIALGLDITQEQIDAIEAKDFAASCFGASDKALLALVKVSTEDVRIDDATFATAKNHFSDREIIETILTGGFYTMLARVTEATDVEIDLGGPDVVKALSKS